jgi:hypothetical protein
MKPPARGATLVSGLFHCDWLGLEHLGKAPKKPKVPRKVTRFRLRDGAANLKKKRK